MKIYFSETDPQPDMFGEADYSGTFEVCDQENNPRYFYCGVDYSDEDQVVIFDGCDRSIPIDINAINSLIEALDQCLNRHSVLERARGIEDELQSDASYFVESTEGFVEFYVKKAQD